jgi:ribokinase
LLQRVAWFTPNETEAAFYLNQLAGNKQSSEPAEIARALLAKGCRGVVLKMGSRGAYLAMQEGQGEVLQAFPVRAVDSTAAGDAFNGAFATALSEGKSSVEAVRFAAAAAAISVTRHGAQPAMASRTEIDAFLSSRRN